MLEQGRGFQHLLCHCSQHQHCLVFGVKDVLAEVDVSLSMGRGSRQEH